MPLLKKSFYKIVLILTIFILILFFFLFDLQKIINLEQIKLNRELIISWYSQYPLLFIIFFMLTYIISTALALPGVAVILTLIAGTVFKLSLGLIIVSFASTIGATLAFLGSRYLLREWVEKKFNKYSAPINRGITEDGAFYLFTLRLVPLFPFFVINVVMGLTRLKIHTFYWVSQLGMLLGTVIYLIAGTQLGKIESVKDILSISNLILFVCLGIFPLLLKKLIDRMKQKRAQNRTIQSNNQSDHNHAE